MTILPKRRTPYPRVVAIEEVPAPEVQQPSTRERGKRGRRATADPKYRRPGFRSFNYYLDEIGIANVRHLLATKKAHGTNPTGVNDMSDLLQFLIEEWYEREKDTW